MGQPDECAELLAKGFSPSPIASKLEISTGSVTQYLFVAVGRGLIRRSDILFNIAPDVRRKIDEEHAALGRDNAVLKGRQPRTDGEVYLCLERDRAFMSDLYVFVMELEMALHELIQAILKSEYGEEETGWWCKGIRQRIREDCVTAREGDCTAPSEPYSYTTFIHLKKIIDKNWSLFARHLPPSVAGDKPRLMDSLTKANAIRNKVMHPVRAERPTHDEFDFVRELHRVLDKKNWHRLPRY